MQFHIETMTCGGCARGVTKTIHKIDPSADVQIDIDKKDVSVTTTAPRDKIAAALTDAGFAPA